MIELAKQEVNLVPRIENDMVKIAKFMGEKAPENLNENQVIEGLLFLGHDASVVVWEKEQGGK